MLIIDKWCLICKLVVNVCFSHKEGHVHDTDLCMKIVWTVPLKWRQLQNEEVKSNKKVFDHTGL